MKTMIEIHALQNYAPSNLNRDDAGAPKEVLFGGTRRARVSSQCLKHSMRRHFAALVQQGILSRGDVALRTKRVLDLLAIALIDRGRPPAEAARKARLALAASKLAPRDDGRSKYLLFLGQREISAIAEIIHEKWDAITDGKTSRGKEKKPGSAEKPMPAKTDRELQRAVEKVLNGGKAVDVALFGRMLADMPERNQYAACQIAHAISTHAVENEFDFYTAMDDLRESSVADMMGTVEFNSACFYRYAVVDWEKLLSNLQEDKRLALGGLRAFLEAFVVAEPTGKQNSFAAHNPPEFVAVSVRRNAAPRSLANAFETAIRVQRDESLTGKSAEALLGKARALKAAFGGEENTFILNLVQAELEGLGEAVPSLEALLDKAQASVQE